MSENLIDSNKNLSTTHLIVTPAPVQMYSDSNYRTIHEVTGGVIVQIPDRARGEIQITNTNYNPYVVSRQPQTHEIHPSVNSKSSVGKQIAIGFIIAVTGVIIVTLIMGSEAWYYGVIVGVGAYIVLRSIYGCYASKGPEEPASRVVDKSVNSGTAPDEEDPSAPV